MKLIDLQISPPCFMLSGILCLLFWGTGTAVFGQVNEQKPDLKFQRIHEGLISNQITAINQDSWGYIWVGTHSGLHRYDGINFQIYTSSEDTNSINDNFIGDIYEDSNNNLWIGTASGLGLYNRSKDNFIRFELSGNSANNNTETNIINTILEDESGKLWIAGGDKQLYYFDEQKQVFIPSESFDNLTINGIDQQENNRLWIATSEIGLVKYRTDTDEIDDVFRHNPSDPHSIASDYIEEIVVDPDGSLWIGTTGSGLDRMTRKGDNIIFRHYRNKPGQTSNLNLGNNDIYTLYIDRKGNLWVGNENGGLHLYDRKNDSFFHYSNNPDDPYSLSHNSIWSIFEDRQGRYWIGTALTGLNMADRYNSKFTHYQNYHSAENSLSNNIVRDFHENDEGIWIATDGGGLNYFDRSKGNFTSLEHDPEDSNSITSDAVIDISEDNNGTLWIGTWGGGVNILTDTQKGHFISFKENINNYTYPIRNVFDTHFDREYEFTWLAGFGEGLYRYDQNSGDLQIFPPDLGDEHSLKSPYITRILEDSKNNLWISTIEGLSLLKSEHKIEGLFKNFLADDGDSTSIPNNSIQQVIEDSRNNIWIATSKGLSKYVANSETFLNYDRSDGLPSNEIKSIVEDNRGNLWIGTLNGISKFDPSENSFENYDESDGLQENEFSRYAAYKLSNGELLFGGMNGFNKFHPDSIKDNPYKPPVYLTDFKLFNKSVAIGEEDSPLNEHIAVTDTLVLSHTHSVFTFDFVALNYTKPEQNQYAFKMEGFEEEWNYVGNQRNATYTNLDPGTYAFRVKAANNDGVWNEEGTSLAVVITPPFWQTSWFYLLAALFIGSVIVAGYRYRVRSIKEYSKRLEQEVSDRTSELNNKNRDLEKALEQLEEARDELVEKAHKAGMADLATGVLHNVGNILTSVNTSASLIEDTIRQSRVEKLSEANTILRENIDHINEFIAENPKGKKLMQYYLKLEEPLKDEQTKILDQSRRLIEKIELINEVIAAQQNYAGASIHAGQTSISKMIDNALALQSGSIERHGLRVEKDLEDVDPIVAQRTKLIHILVNLFKNAKEAMADNPPREKKISIKAWQDEEWVYLSISDNGSGISREQLDKIFTHGFTTKESGHGFGLHSSANYMTEMGGRIEVSSDGKEKGATFTLLFPRVQAKKDKNTNTDVDLEYPGLNEINE